MKIFALEISGFRGIESARVFLSEHDVLIGPNGVGKSTIIDALSLVFGRSKMVPVLTEHDFRGSDPARASRILIVATLGGFAGDDPNGHRNWFRDRRAVEKYWCPDSNEVLPARSGTDQRLCVQVAFAARFDHDELVVDTVRYFHDGPPVDAFTDDVVLVPSSLLSEVGFYVLPARRSWDLALSFASEFFKKAVATAGALPSSAVLNVRDQVRNPTTPVEADAAMNPFVVSVNDFLGRLLPGAPQLRIRLTSTDSDSVLRALVPHYEVAGSPSLPAGRHGGGLVALQTLTLLLELGRARRAEGKSFILALEEPELHVPPGLQRQIVAQARSSADQTICTTHSPRIATSYGAGEVHLVRRALGCLEAPRLLSEPPLGLPNAARKLLVDERHRLLEALMYPIVLVPEGRIDAEFVRLLVDIAYGVSGPGAQAFETSVGTVPTPDGSVVGTSTRLAALGARVLAVVDGDGEGDLYRDNLRAGRLAAVTQWPAGWMIEDVVAWVAAADPATFGNISTRLGGVPIAGEAELATRLRSQDRAVGGLKSHYLAYEEIAFALRASQASADRAASLLDAMAGLPAARTSPFYVQEPPRATDQAPVFRFTIP